MELKIRINKSEELIVKEEKERVLLNNLPLDLFDIKKIGEDHFLIYKGEKVYDLRVLDKGKNRLVVNINGHLLDLEIKDYIAQMLEKLGMDVTENEVIQGINAPMPGGILEVFVKQGDEVKKGDRLIILEAMKMENVIKAPVNGVVATVYVTAGDTVEKNQLLLSF